MNGVRQHEKNRTGEIIAVRGNIIDIRFPQPLPPRNQQLSIGSKDQDLTVFTLSAKF